MMYYIYMKLNNKKLNEGGFAPIIVSMIIITVLSLMTVGFILLMDNNQSNTLNRQLNNDAYYAAESGINDAIQAINHGFDVPKTTCPHLLPPYRIPGSKYLSNDQVQGTGDYYSCLLINPTPAYLQYSSVMSSQPTVAILSAVNPINPLKNEITSLEISWQLSAQIAGGTHSFAPPSWYPQCSSSVNGPCLPPKVNWVSSGNPIPGVIRIALTPLQSGPLPTNTKTTYTGFFYPVAGVIGSAPNKAPPYGLSTIGANSGELVSGNCYVPSSTGPGSNPDACNVNIPLSGASGASNFLMELRSIYNPSMVTITAYHNSTQLLLRNAQIVIDSTGDSEGVLKRIQVTVPGIDDIGFPAYDLGSSRNICSDLLIHPSNQTTQQPGGVFSNCSLSS